jgi:U3 small nucleolar RNA-associated protein 22
MSVIPAGFDPAELLRRDLQNIYADTFKIFHDPFGGDMFGAVWDPTLRNARPFRILGGFSIMSAPKGEKGKEKDRGLVMLNEAAVLAEITRLGEGIIAS